MLLFGGALRTYENNFLNLEDNNYKKSLILGSYISMLSRGESGDLIKYSKDALFKLHNKFQGIKNKSDLEHEKADYSIRFKDVIGYDDVKDKLRVLIDYMISPEKFDMARIAPERGYLFYGLPGSGKSFMAKALAGELKALSKNKNKEWFIKFTAKDYEKYGFASIMSYAKKHAPCILFIDEVDGLQLSRSQSGKPNTILSEMQTSMDGETESSPDKKVIILATTNKLESIDQSLKRPGRFGEKIPFNLPTREERTIFLEDHLEENGLYISEELQSKIIRETDNLSLAELNKILSSAKRTALATCKPVTENDFVKALDSHHRLVSNDTNSNNEPISNLSKKELKIVAAHQVGRALAILLLQKNKKLSLITTNAYYENVDENEDEVSRKLIEPKIKHGMTLEYSDYNSKFKTTAELEDNCQVELAGHIAQEILLNTCSFQYRPQDQENALNITQEILLSGESKETLSKEKFDHKLNLASELKDNLKVRVKALLLKNKENLSNLYNSLLSKGILRDNNIYKLIN